MSSGYAAIFFVFIPLIGLPFLVILTIELIQERRNISLMSPQVKERYLEAQSNEINYIKQKQQYGLVNSAMICPHCQTKGKVRTKQIIQKKGVSGGKATAAVLTGGLSLLATGLSRKEKLMQAHCDNCENTWLF
jgi:uncharacterized paraquat-inducible protein A